MSIAVKFNGKGITDTGLVCCMSTLEDGNFILDILDSTKAVDATGVIKVNNEVVEDACVTIDTVKNECVLDTLEVAWQTLDLSKIHIEVNIFGDIELD